jgi:small-conductance mechanosensitive channel
MDQSIASLLFSTAVIGNLVVISLGLVAALFVFFLRERAVAAERREARRLDESYRATDTLNASRLTTIFVAAATALVVVGLPVALAFSEARHKTGELAVAQFFFSAAVIGNFVFIGVGLAVSLVASFHQARLASTERNEAAKRHDASFHHPDPVSTSLLEKLFMTAATALVLVGLPVVLAATFHYLLPLLGHVADP